MKLSKQQLEKFESLLESQGYKRDQNHKGDWMYYKALIKEDHFALYIEFNVYDFSRYSTYQPKEFPISFEPMIIIVQNSLSTTLEIPFFYDKHPLFVKYDEGKNGFVEMEWNDKKIWKYLDNLEDVARTFMIFYNHSVTQYIIE